MITLLLFLLLLSVLVLIHELGHFLVAKKLGIKVEEFGFGFPPKAFSIKKGETEYSINWLPIGGFVKLYGEDEAGDGRVSLQARDKEQKTKNEDLKRAYFARPVGQRAAVVFAGVLMNTFLAIAIFYLYLAIAGFRAEVPLYTRYSFFYANQNNISGVIVRDVAPNSPAQNAGIKPPVKIISVNSEQITDEKRFVDIIKANRGKKVVIAWQEIKTFKTYTKELIPRINPPKNQGALGVAFHPLPYAVVSYDTFDQKIFSGVTYPLNLLLYNFSIMSRLIQVSFEEKTVAPVGEGFAGPVGIFSLVGSILQIENIKELVLQLLNLAGILSISLAFFNVLPIPALDGGRLFFILIEAASGRKVSPKFESMAHAIGMAILLTLIFLITIKDISRFIQ